jgi:hypothetical protein
MKTRSNLFRIVLVTALSYYFLLDTLNLDPNNYNQEEEDPNEQQQRRITPSQKGPSRRLELVHIPKTGGDID